MERRELLKATGIVGTFGILGVGAYAMRRGTPSDGPPDDNTTDTEHPSGRTETPDGDDEERTTDQIPHASEFETVVDAVEVGADPTGEQPVDPLFEQYADDDVLLAFEPGTYKLDYFTVAGATQLGVVGTGDEPARFVPAEGRCRGGHPWVFFDGVNDFLFENLAFDFRDVDSGGPIHLNLGGDSVVRDVTYRGNCSNQIGVFRIDIRDADGTAVVERLRARNDGGNNSLTGVYVGDSHAGELTFRDCDMSAFSDNGLYASAPGKSDGGNGPVHVVGGTYRNNNVANVRLGSSGSRAEDVTVVVDRETAGWGGLNARGIRLRNRSGQVIEGCDITFGEDAADSFGGIVFHPDNGGATVRDTAITIDRDAIPAIRAFPVSTPGDDVLTFENLSIDGAAPAGPTARIEGRDDTVFENCTIEQSKGRRSGLRFIDSTDCRIVDSRIEVAEAPVAVEDSTVEIKNCMVRTAAGEERIEHRVLENETLTF